MIRTYEHPYESDIVAVSSATTPAVTLVPGAWVRHKYHLHSFGMLIANGDDFITVLWSIAPERSSVVDTDHQFIEASYVMNPYVPVSR